MDADAERARCRGVKDSERICGKFSASGGKGFGAGWGFVTEFVLPDGGWLKKSEGGGVRAAGEEAGEGGSEGIVGGGADGVEEGEGGVELEVVGVGEDLLGGAGGRGGEG